MRTTNKNGSFVFAYTHLIFSFNKLFIELFPYIFLLF